MRTRFRIASPLSAPVALLAAALALGGGSRALAEEGNPAPPVAPEAPAPEGQPADDGDADDSDTPVSLQDRVKKAVESGVKWLKQAQLPNGSWGDIVGNRNYGDSKGDAYHHPAGSAALALYTLLKCKEPLSDPVIQKGFKFLRDKHKKPGGAYETAMMLLAVTATADPFKRVKASEAQGDKVRFPTPEWQTWAQSLRDHLLGKRAKAKVSGWRYMVDDNDPKTINTGGAPGGNEDMSCTQLAVLALLAAERCGMKTDSKIWNEIINFTLKQQEDEGPEWDRAVYDRKNAPTAAPAGGDKSRYAPPPGTATPKDNVRGFAYIKSKTLPPDEGTATGGMTACGVGNLMVARYVLARRDDKVWEGRDQKSVQRGIYDGCAWLDANWLTWGNPKKVAENKYDIYHMYCCERAFDLIGNNLVGKHAWYSDFAEELTTRQDATGFWNSGSTHKPEAVLDTCFALLVLKRSTKGGIPAPSVTGGGDAPPDDNRGGK